MQLDPDTVFPQLSFRFVCLEPSEAENAAYTFL
jgi:hypothetical protein